MVKTVLISFIVFLCTFDLISQTGPAGVGTSANNVLWLKADAGTSTTTDGAALSSWNDQSGNGINVTQTISVQQPSFATNVINGYPAIEFDNTSNTNDKLLGPDSPLLDNTNGYTFFTVSRLSSITGDAQVVTSKRTTISVDQSFMLFYYTGRKFHVDIQTTNDRYSTPTTFTSNTNYLIDVVYDGTLPAAQRAKTYVGENLDITSSENNSLVPDNLSPLIIGSTDLSDGRPFAGYISEVIIYRTALNDASRIIVNNHLSSKYGISLTANDRYVGDTPANGDFDRGVSGIGKDNVGGANTTFSASTTLGLGITANSGLDNNDYILAGYASTLNYAITTDVGGMTGINNARWLRVWYVDVTNTSTNINTNIEFDMSDAGVVATPSVASNYVLLYRAGLTGNWTELTTATSVAGDKILFNGYTLTNDGYYTIGTRNYVNSTLPIELLSFNAIMNNKKVDITWTTATEINNDYFTIERSKDGVNFDPVRIVDGAGNSTSVINYFDVDSDPLQGISYYRLKQTDFNKTFTYSGIVAVNYVFGEEGISVYPNPSTGNFYIDLTGLQNKEVLVVLRDAMGRECFSKVIIAMENKEMIAIDQENKLASGTYIIIATSDNKLYSHKIIVK